jgi:RNA polymerase sigma-70 factor (ECF subfamily)
MHGNARRISWAPTGMTEDRDEIEEMVDGLRRGETEALAPLFAHHRDRLRRMIDFRLDARLRGRVSTSDVLQEAYIDGLKRLQHFRADPDVPFFVWLRTITLQRLIQVHRQHLGAQARNAAREVSLGPMGGTEASSEKMIELVGDLTSPSQAAVKVEMMARVRAALDQLGPLDREILALRHFEELSNHEVAALLGIQAAAASKRYVRAIERLREALED